MESGRRLRKLLRCIEDNDLVKLKRYVKKYHIDTCSVRLPDGASLLHRACALGYDTIARYFLKKGADMTVCDYDGNTALHLACMYARGGNKYAYTDLVLPLMKKWPEGVDMQNDRKVTPRHLLQMIKQELLQEYKLSEPAIESDESPDPQAAWKERLADEASYEFTEQTDTYHEDYEEEHTETLDDWANRMRTEYHRKHQPTHTTKRSSTCDDDDEHSRKQKLISDEKQKEFQRKLKEDHAKYLERCTKRSKTKLLKQRQIYREKCERLFQPTVESSDLLGWCDIPWPLSKDHLEDLTKVEEFIFFDMDRDNDEYKKYLREQQVQWHPDKFLQKCGARLKDEDRERIMERVKQIAQILNQLSSGCNK